jgi:hypothetical protein
MRFRFHQLAVALFMFCMSNASATVLYVDLNSTSPTPPYANWAIAATSIQDAVAAANTGDLILVTNGLYRTGGASRSGINRVVVDKALIIDSVNGAAATIIDGLSLARCVYLTNGAILNGFTLTNGAADFGGGIYSESSQALVLNCILVSNTAAWYGGGACYGTLANCVFTSNSCSSGGAGYGCTLVNSSIVNNFGGEGGGTMQCTSFSCVFTNNTAFIGGASYQDILNSCTLIGNQATAMGGGASSGTLSACTLIGNSADSAGGGADQCVVVGCVLSNNSSSLSGGGANNSTMTNCVLTANTSFNYGGGARNCTLVNCTVVSNTAPFLGAGVDGGYVYNSIVYYNIGGGPAPNIAQAEYNYCCTTPQLSVPDGGGNINRDPGFVDGSFHLLQSNSPCINAGNNIYVTSPTDLDGNPRIVGGTVDIGAYECQNPSSVISYAWLQQYGLATDGSADYADTDHDGMNNWQEWIAGTDPTNSLSVLQMLAPSNSVSGFTLTWQSVSGKTYYLQRGTNLLLNPAFSSIQSNIIGQAATTSFTDTNTPNPSAYFYRVGIQQ